jgi:hypothetical protein
LSTKLSSLGLILLLVGAICLGIGVFNLRNVSAVLLEREDSVWFHAANLTRGVTYVVDIQSSDDWGKPWASGDFTKAMPVNVTITSPGGGVTSLQVFYYSEPPTSPYYEVGIPPAMVAVNYGNFDSVGLTADTSAVNIRFMARQDGLYNVSVLQASLWSQVAPDYILFSKEVSPNGATYSILATVGGVMCAVGGVTYLVSLFGTRGSRRKSRK